MVTGGSSPKLFENFICVLAHLNDYSNVNFEFTEELLLEGSLLVDGEFS